MPSLLIPTDLSDASRNAAIHGLRLFGSDATSVTLLHTYVDPALSDPFLVGLTLTPGLDNAASDALRAFKEEVGGSLGGSVPRFNSRVLLGSLPGVVKALHQEEHYDLVVMPLLGEGGGYGSLFGSEVADVIKSVRVPVLAVPPQATFHGLAHVLLADDGGDLVPGAFGLMLELARRHSAEVTVVHVEDPNTLSTSVGPDPIYHAMLGDLPHTFLTVEDEQVAVAIDHEAVANKVDLVTVLHRHLGPLESLFHKSTAEQLALHAHVPLLVLQQ